MSPSRPTIWVTGLMWSSLEMIVVHGISRWSLHPFWIMVFSCSPFHICMCSLCMVSGQCGAGRTWTGRLFLAGLLKRPLCKDLLTMEAHSSGDPFTIYESSVRILIDSLLQFRSVKDLHSPQETSHFMVWWSLSRSLSWIIHALRDDSDEPAALRAERPGSITYDTCAACLEKRRWFTMRRSLNVTETTLDDCGHQSSASLAAALPQELHTTVIHGHGLSGVHASKHWLVSTEGALPLTFHPLDCRMSQLEPISIEGLRQLLVSSTSKVMQLNPLPPFLIKAAVI